MLRVKSTQNIIHTNSFLHYGKFFNQFSSGIHNFCIFKRSLYLLLKKKKYFKMLVIIVKAIWPYWIIQKKHRRKVITK